jgi:inner membrane transporter RhtA
MPTLRYSSLVPALAILGAVTFLALGTSWAKHTLFPLIGAEGTTAVRVGFSALLLLALWRPWRWRMTRSDTWRVACYGAALGAMNLCFYLSLRTISFGVAVAIEFSGPLAVALLSSRRPMDFVWILLAVVGLGMLLPIGHAASGLDPLGILFALAAAFFWATYILCGKRVGHLHSGHSVSLGLVVAAVVVVPIGVAHAGMALLSPSILVVGLSVAALSSAIPMSLEMVALKRLPQHTFSIMISMEPAVAALVALGLLDEQLSVSQWLAIGLIMAASMGSAASAQRVTSAADPGSKSLPDAREASIG